jgi:ABC-type Na+ transport system ATPase subunit NatA
MFFGRLGGLRHKELRRTDEELSVLLQLDKDMDKLACLYSGGMKRRVLAGHGAHAFAGAAAPG